MRSRKPWLAFSPLSLIMMISVQENCKRQQKPMKTFRRDDVHDGLGSEKNFMRMNEFFLLMNDFLCGLFTRCTTRHVPICSTFVYI